MVKKIRPASCCGGATRIGKSIVRNASKSMEKTMINQAKSLFKNPYIVLPEYTDAESKKRFRKIRKQLQKVDNSKEDIKKLEKLANKRNLAGAVAGTLLVAHAEKAPFLAAARLPTGNVNYAQRGQAPKEYLIAAQHTNDPFFRILGIRDVALKYHLHIYSWDKGFVSTGLKPNPPEGFVDFVSNKLKYKKDDNVVHCSHLPKEQILKKQLSSQPYLLIHWKSANLYVAMCQSCASKKDNLIFSLTQYLIADDLTDDFSVEVIGSLIKDDSLNQDVDTQFIDDFFLGKYSNYHFIEKNMNYRREELEDANHTIYIHNEIRYDSVNDFIDSLDPNDEERNALQKMLSLHKKSIIISDSTPNDVLSLYWDKYDYDIIYDITHDEKITKDIISLSEIPSVMVKTAFDVKRKQQVLDLLPNYKSLPDIASYTDDLARIYRVQGKQKLFSTLRSPPNQPKKKAIAYGMLLVINKHADVKWKFSKIAIESGEFLKPYLEKLLNGEAKEYHETLQNVLNASGYSESLDDFLNEQ